MSVCFSWHDSHGELLSSLHSPAGQRCPVVKQLHYWIKLYCVYTTDHQQNAKWHRGEKGSAWKTLFPSSDIETVVMRSVIIISSTKSHLQAHLTALQSRAS